MREGSQRLHVDWTRCEARGLCAELLPEVLDLDDWGYPLSRSGEASPVIGRAIRRHAERAVTECPRLALSLRSDDSE